MSSTSNPLVREEHEQQFESVLRNLQGKRVRWESSLLNVGTEFAEVSGSFSNWFNLDDRPMVDMSMGVRFFAGDEVRNNDGDEMGFRLADLGRERYRRLETSTPVLVEGEIAKVAYHPRSPAADLLQRFTEDDVRIYLVRCRISLKHD